MQGTGYKITSKMQSLSLSNELGFILLIVSRNTFLIISVISSTDLLLVQDDVNSPLPDLFIPNCIDFLKIPEMDPNNAFT